MKQPNELRNQLERIRFEKAIEIAESNTHGQKHINPGELAHLNQILTNSTADPWRTTPAEIQLPSGKKIVMSVLNNPVLQARDLISNARIRASQGELVEAATDLYANLLGHHFFLDANRRTAVVAVFWLLAERKVRIDAVGLIGEQVGDVRDPADLSRLSVSLTQHIGRNRASGR